MNGVAEENLQAVEMLIQETLTQLAANGFEPDMIEAALNTIEFSLRENNTGSFPARSLANARCAQRLDLRWRPS